jgi:hypothetical protein
VIVDAYQPDANFVSARSIEVAAAPERMWEVLPELPVALRGSPLAKVGAVPLLLASLLRGEHGRGAVDFGRTPWTFREGVVLAGLFSVDRVDPGREVVLVGRHRMADYATNFYIEPMGNGQSRLYNVTRAKFRTTGLGRIYLAGVRVFHNLYVDRWLRTLKRRAESR